MRLEITKGSSSEQAFPLGLSGDAGADGAGVLAGSLGDIFWDLAMKEEQMRTYVEILYPGSLFSEEEIHAVSNRDVKQMVKTLPANAFSFQFFDQVSKEVEVDGDKRTVHGKRKNLSPKYYPEAQTFTLKQIKKLGPDYSILASNMECNNWPVVVKTRQGNFQPFENGDVIL